MSSIVPERLESPKCTSNQLADIISWLKLGDCVILCNGTYIKYIYHNCIENNSDKVRLIIIDCQGFPGLLDDGEWNWYIEDSGNKKCNCKDPLEWIKNSVYKYTFAT